MHSMLSLVFMAISMLSTQGSLDEFQGEVNQIS